MTPGMAANEAWNCKLRCPFCGHQFDRTMMDSVQIHIEDNGEGWKRNWWICRPCMAKAPRPWSDLTKKPEFHTGSTKG